MGRLETRVSKLESGQRMDCEFGQLSDDELERRILVLGQRLGLLDEAGRYVPGSTAPRDACEQKLREHLIRR